MHLSACMLTSKFSCKGHARSDSGQRQCLNHAACYACSAVLPCTVSAECPHPGAFFLSAAANTREGVRSTSHVFFKALPYAQWLCLDLVAGVLTTNLRLLPFATYPLRSSLYGQPVDVVHADNSYGPEVQEHPAESGSHARKDCGRRPVSQYTIHSCT